MTVTRLSRTCFPIRQDGRKIITDPDSGADGCRGGCFGHPSTRAGRPGPFTIRGNASFRQERRCGAPFFAG